MIAILQAPSITLHGPIMMSGCMFTAGYHGAFPLRSTAKYSIFFYFLLQEYSVLRIVLSFCLGTAMHFTLPKAASPAGRHGDWPFGSAFLQDWHLITYCHSLQAESDERHHISTGAALEKTVNLCGVEFDVVYFVWAMIIYPLSATEYSQLLFGV